MSDNKTVTDGTSAASGDGAQNAPPVVTVDPEVVARIVAEMTKREVEKEAPVKDQAPIAINQKAGEAAPKVVGEYVPDPMRRAVRYIRSVIRKDAGEDERIRRKGVEDMMEIERQQRAIHPLQFQREEEDISGLIKESGLSHKVQKRLHSTLSGPAGEFLLPKPFLAEVFVIMEQYGLARQNTRQIAMTTKDLDLKNISTKPTVAWTGESARFTESDLALSEQKMTTTKLAAITSMTTEQSEDEVIALMPLWIANIAEDLAKKEDQAWLLGDGTSTYGGFTGITQLTNINTFTAGSSDLNFSNIVEADFRSTREKLTLARRVNAKWIMHYGMWNVIEQYESTVGARIVQEILTAEAPRRLLGYPVLVSEAMVDATTDVANVVFAVLGDTSRTLMGTARNLTVDASREAVLSDSNGVVTFNAYQQDGQLVRISERIGFKTPTAYESGYTRLLAPAS